MNDNFILERIKSLMLEKNLSENALSKLSGLPQSTINSLFLKNNVPTLPTLERICEGLNIPLSQLLMGDEEYVVTLDATQRELLECWNVLNQSSQNVLLDTARSLKNNQVN